LRPCPRSGNVAATTTHDTTNWAALPVLLAGAFMVVLDFFIVNVALPSIATDLGAGNSSLEWIVAGYGLTFAAFLITAGRLGDDLGRRRVYAIGLAFFTLASAACGLAPSLTTLGSPGSRRASLARLSCSRCSPSSA
jgi:MFS family permease